MNKNRFNQLSTYEDVFNNFSEILNELLEKYNSEDIYKYNVCQKGKNKDGFKNSLIEDDFSSLEELTLEIKDSYLSRDYLEGEIGLTDGQSQYDGIFNIALYMLTSNRLAKLYKYSSSEYTELDEDTSLSHSQKYKNLISKKQDAIIKLIYSLYIYSETENDNDFFYGYSTDASGNSILVIDLPVYGQISVHFGSEENFERLKYVAKKCVNLTLEKKLELGQITDEQFTKIMDKANSEGIFPLYTGKLYEYSSAFPLDYCGKKFEIAQKKLKLSSKMVTDISDNDIKRISQDRKYNSRELYYFAIKSDFSKRHLKKLSQYLQIRDARDLRFKNPSSSISSSSIGKAAVELTTAEERKIVASHEDLCYSRTKNNSKEK